MSYIIREMNGEESYMKGFHNILSKQFFKGVGPIKKQNRDQMVSHVCTTTTLKPYIKGFYNIISKPFLKGVGW